MTGRKFQQFHCRNVVDKKVIYATYETIHFPIEANFFFKSYSYDSKTSRLFGKKSDLIFSEIMDLLALKTKQNNL